MFKISRVFLVVCLLLSGLFLGGCKESQLDVEIYSDPKETIYVHVGQEFIIELESNPTTGYTWQEESDQNVLHLLDRHYKPDHHRQEPGFVGSGGTEYFHYRVVGGGKTSITLTYAQYWEGGDVSPPLIFTVNSSLNSEQ